MIKESYKYYIGQGRMSGDGHSPVSQKINKNNHPNTILGHWVSNI